MSIGWEKEEIMPVIAIMAMVGKALRDPAETAPMTAEGIFVRRLGKTLSGLVELLEKEVELSWEDDLVEHARNLRIGAEEFIVSVRRSEIRVQEASRTSYVISRSEQFRLEDYVKSLQDATSRAQLVLDTFITLRILSSLLEQSRTTTLTVEELKSETQRVCRTLPTIASSINGLDEARPSQFRGLRDVQQYAEFLIRGDLDDTKTSLLELQEVQIPLSQESRAQWQQDLEVTIEELCSCCRMHLAVLLNRQSGSQVEVRETQKNSWHRAINSLVQIIDGDLAGGLSIAYALEEHEEPSEALETTRSLAQLEGRGNGIKPEFLLVNERECKPVTLSLKKPVQQKSYLPIPARSVQPYNRPKEMGSGDSSDKENSYGKSSQARGQTSDWVGSSFSKPTWGSKSHQSNPRITTPITKFQQRMFQRQNKSALSHELSPEAPKERPTRSMLGPDQYSFALERWANDSDHLEMLLNTGEQSGKPDQGILIAVPEDYASAVGRFPKILLKTMADWDDAYNSTASIMSPMGNIQIAT